MENSNLKISDILKKHNITEFIRQSDQWGEDDYRYDALKAAIKEIVEATIDLCAENNKKVERFTGDTDEFGVEYSSSVRYIEETASEQSILNVKTMINYE